jgi:aspartate aminotransferase
MVVVEALRHHAHEKNYLPAQGLPELRQAVSRFHSSKDNVEIRPEGVLIGPGSKELMFLLQLVYYGELVLPTPCWVSYIPQANIIGRNVRLIHTPAEDGWRLSAERLERLCSSQNDKFRPRVIILNYPGNPDGCTYTADELQAIAEVSRKYQVILLSDEIYGQLHHQGTHVSVARYYPEGTIISSGLSKWCGAGGWRLGTFSFPPELDWLLDKMAAVASETYTSVCAPIQHAAVRAFSGGVTIERYLWHVRRILSALGNEAAVILNEAGLRVFPPTGAFYLFLDFTPLAEKLARRGITDSGTLCEQLLADTGVAILPGEAFGRDRAELTARLAYVDFDGARALAASETLALDSPLPTDFTSVWCERVRTACNLIAEWANAGS